MESFAAIIVSHADSTSKAKGSAKRELLYSKGARWLEKTIVQCGIEDIFLLQDDSLSLEDIGGDTVLKNWEDNSWGSIREKGIETLLLLSADCPCLAPKEIFNALIYHKSSDSGVTLFSSFGDSVSGAGWYQREKLEEITTNVSDSATLEDYTEYINIKNMKHHTFKVDDNSLVACDTAKNRSIISEILRQRIIDYHLENDVEIPIQGGVIIGIDVEIEPEAQILAGSIIRGKSKILGGAIIGPNSEIVDSTIGKDSKIGSSKIEESKIGEDCKIGPMVHVRPNCNIGNGVKIGNFVEIKNSNIGPKTSVSHLTYIGDSDVGESCNIGCGVVTVNYDGKNKHRTTVGDNVFVGCNCNLIAPVTMEDRSYAAAGTTITHDVPKDSLAIGRVNQTVKKDWCKKKKLFDKHI